MIAAFAYDPVRRLVYVAVNSRYQSGDTSYPSPGYVYVIDATLDQLLATLSPFDLASLGTSACSLGSNTSCFETQGDLAVDLTGQALYFLGYDQNGAPMAATMVLNGIDAGTLQNVLGGQAGGWLATANGIVTFDDGGAMAGVWLTDGGGGVEVLDPTLDSEALLPTALANVSANCDVDPSLSVQAFMLGGVAGITLFSGPSPIAFVAGLENYNQYCPNAPISALRAAFAKIAATEEVCLEVVFECQPDTGPAVTGLIYTSYCCPDE
jgi:hypothetical protein